MKSRPKVGSAGELRLVVEQKHIIDFATDGMPSVLSTPNLIGLLERTARETMEPFLDPNERTLGIEIDLKHLAPTPMGASLTCSARIIRVDGKQVTFQIEARDAHEVVARGIHTRAVVQIESFARRVARKTAAA